jgi:cobalt-zinc-cadmium efflux system protein
MAENHKAVTGSRLDARLWGSVALNLAITLVEFAGGLWGGSVALLADSAHNLADAAAVGLAIFARRLSRRAPTPRHTYGFKRAEVIAALLNSAGLIAISVLVAREAVGRLFHPQPARVPVMLVTASVALIANLLCVLLLRNHRTEDINVKSAFLHLLQDALASMAVIIAALVSGTAGGAYADPAAAILISVIVLRSTMSIVWESIHTLLEAAPAGLDVQHLAEIVARRFPTVRLHHIHIWEVGPSQRILTAHMKVSVMNVCDAESLAAEVRRFLQEEWNINHATLEAEANGCGSEQLLGEWK